MDIKAEVAGRETQEKAARAAATAAVRNVMVLPSVIRTNCFRVKEKRTDAFFRN
jgi:hypothetical protein